ncbi:L-glyceraldehyde 3-phosphate reductase [Opitutaceae bacterium EW11]|nr:L-glyceraldehyde 3-phosphate reductase [Opitutaceae bacterium EW11]
MAHQPSPQRYDNPALYRRCGRSGLKLPLLSLGLWHNFGDTEVYQNCRALVLKAFDLGITHFDLANNYGPPPGAAERNFGRILAADLREFRDELIISTKAGYDMWPGPYGDWGSRKYLLASLDQSLKRLGLEYVDIFYHHRFDPNTPLEETMGALDHAVRSGKALYAGISNYGPEQTARAAEILRKLGTPLLIHQPKYHMFDRTVENGLLDVLSREGVGCIPFCPLAQGLLTGRYLNGIPADSRAAHDPRFLKPEHITEEKVGKIRRLNELAQARGQSLAQLALAWVLRQPAVTTALIGASKVSQLEENLQVVRNLGLSPDEVATIDRILAS